MNKPGTLIHGRVFLLSEIESLCQRLQLAAMRCKTHDIFVEYSGHVDHINVLVFKNGTQYTNDGVQNRSCVLCKYARLDADEAYGQLVAIVDELKAMGVEV